MADAREFDARVPVTYNAIRKPAPFSLFRYLALLPVTPASVTDG